MPEELLASAGNQGQVDKFRSELPSWQEKNFSLNYLYPAVSIMK
jgi:hypothetical protein